MLNAKLQAAIEEVALARRKDKRQLADELFAKLLDDFNLTRAEISMVKTEILNRSAERPFLTVDQIVPGVKYRPMGSSARGLCTVVDIHKTYNMAGELVKTRYVTTHEFMGQTITESDVVAPTIQRGYINDPGRVL